VPVQSACGDIKLPFRIEGMVDIKAVRSGAGRKAALEQDPRPAFGLPEVLVAVGTLHLSC
jgi:hypothetical protein